MPPLPGITEAKQCFAKSKSTQQRCRNPAKAPLKVCRLHGWNYNRTPKGRQHYNHQGKHESRPERATRATAFKEMKALAAILTKLDKGSTSSTLQS